MSILFKRIKDWATSITAFRTGDVIPVDGPSGTAKMSKDSLLSLTTDTALVDNLAPKFDPTKPNDDGGFAYYAGASVLYNGRNYVFTVNHRSGPWNFSEVEQKPLSSVVDFGSVGEAVNTWLDEHPEATTTVQDGSLTEAKFSDALKLKTINPFITPEMFGAKGDGVTDDTAAIQAAISACRNAQRGTYVLLKPKSGWKYRVEQNLYIWGGVCVQGAQRWGSWIDLHNGASVIFQNSFYAESTQVEEARLKFLTIDGNYETDYCVQMGTPDHTHSVTQCLMEDIYMQHANVAACYVQGGINYLNHCYFYYSPIGLKTYNVNALYVEECNFWDNSLSVDLDRAQNANFTNDWFEGGTSAERGDNNVQIKVGINTTAFFTNCQFQGSTSPTQRILWQDSTESQYNFSLVFDKCRFMYAFAEGSLFGIKGYNEVHLTITNSFYYSPQLTSLINTSLMNAGALKYLINGNIAYDNASKAVTTFSDDTKCESQGIFTEGSFKPMLPNGVILGTQEPVSPANGNLLFKGDRPYIYAGYYQRLFTGDDVIIPERYGAKGDGTTDDSSAFQEALNYAVGKGKPLLLIASNYLISTDINIKNATTVRGLVRQNKITLSDGALIKVGLENANAAEIRIENITIDCSGTSDYGLVNAGTYELQQFYLTSFAILNAVDSGLKIKGTRIFISKGYVTDCGTAFDISGKLAEITECYLYRNTISIAISSDSCEISDTWLDSASVANAKHLSVESSSKCIFKGCYFAGGVQSNRVLVEGSSKSYELNFDDCLFVYTGTQSKIFEISTSSGDSVNLLFTGCTVDATISNSFIDNSMVSPGTFGLLWYNNTHSLPAVVSAQNTYCVNMGLSDGPNKTPLADSGLIIGSNKPVADNNLSGMDGFFRYDSNIQLMQYVANGAYCIIPKRASTAVPKLSNTATLTDVVTKINDLITVLGNESKIITY